MPSDWPKIVVWLRTNQPEWMATLKFVTHNQSAFVNENQVRCMQLYPEWLPTLSGYSQTSNKIVRQKNQARRSSQRYVQTLGRQWGTKLHSKEGQSELTSEYGILFSCNIEEVNEVDEFICYTNQSCSLQFNSNVLFIR